MTRQTSVEAYYRIKQNGLLSELKMEVYEILYQHGPLTGRQVHALYSKGSSVNYGVAVTRLSELRELGVVEELGITKCPITKRKVILWDVTVKIPIKLPKKISKNRQIKELKEDCMALATELASVQEELDDLKLRISKEDAFVVSRIQGEVECREDLKYGMERKP